MTDIARLAVRIDSDGVVTTTNRLDRMGDGAERSERRTTRATDRIGQAFSRAAKNAGNLINRMRLMAAVFGVVGTAALALRQEMAAVSATAAGLFVNVKLDPFRERLASVAGTTTEVRQQMEALFRVANDAGVIAVSIGEGFSQLVAASSAAGSSFKNTVGVIDGFIVKAASMGATSDEINKILMDLVPLTKQSRINIGDLADVLAFTNDPTRVLAQSLGVTEQRVRKLIEANATLSQKSLLRVGNQLRSTAEQSSGLNESWNRLVNTLTKVADRFNQLGVIDVVITQLERLNQWLQTQDATRLIQKLAEVSVHFFSVTLPNFVRAVYTHWGTIVNVMTVAITTLIGTAAGGVYGGLLGLGAGLLLVSDNSGKAGSGLKTLATDIEDSGLIKAIKEIGKWVNATVDGLNGLLELQKKVLEWSPFTTERTSPKDVPPWAVPSVFGVADPIGPGKVLTDIGPQSTVVAKPLATGGGGGGGPLFQMPDLSGGITAGQAMAYAQQRATQAATERKQAVEQVTLALATQHERALMTYQSQIDLINANVLNAQKASDLKARAWDRYAARVAQDTQNISQFAVQASHNIQDTLGNSLERILGGHFDNIGQMWLGMIREMAAQAAAANLNKALFGDSFGKTGEIGGLIGQGIGSLFGAYSPGTISTGSAMASGLSPAAASGAVGASGGGLGNLFSGFFADGGTIGPGRWGIAGEAGPEVVTGGYSGATITPISNGKTTVNNKTEINVTYQEAEGKTPSERDTDHGEFMRGLEQTVKGVMLKDVAERGEFSRGLQGVYGLKRQGAA